MGSSKKQVKKPVKKRKKFGNVTQIAEKRSRFQTAPDMTELKPASLYLKARDSQKLFA
jgi:hypothetical protein